MPYGGMTNPIPRYEYRPYSRIRRGKLEDGSSPKNPITYGSAYTKVNPIERAAKIAAQKKMGRK